MSTTVGDTVRELARRFASAGIESAGLDAALLVGHALGLDRTRLLVARERRLEPREAAAVAALADRRSRHEPIAYLVGAHEFWSLPLGVDRSTLIPRPESETLIEAALEHLPRRDQALRILDLGTGSGCLLLALLSERPRAHGVGVDISVEACRQAQANAQALGLATRAAFVVGDWAAALAARFDLIVANPPYLALSESARLAPEVLRYEPPRALFAGADGLAAYRALGPALAHRLKDAGLAVIEHGAGQGRKVVQILEKFGLRRVEARVDLGRRERCLVLQRAAPVAAANHLATKKNSCKPRGAD